jgi:hypothetical protein
VSFSLEHLMRMNWKSGGLLLPRGYFRGGTCGHAWRVETDRSDSSVEGVGIN